MSLDLDFYMCPQMETKLNLYSFSVFIDIKFSKETFSHHFVVIHRQIFVREYYLC